MEENSVENVINNTDINQINDLSGDDNNKNIKKKIVLGITGAILLALIVGLIVYLSGGNNRKLIAQLDLGNKYLEEYEYEEAIACFAKAIEIDPMSVEAYLGLVEAYIELNDYDTAYDWAKKGYELTNAPELKEKMDMIDSGAIFDAKGRPHLDKGYDENGKLIGMARYTYNRDKRDTVERLTADGNVAFSVKSEYDEEGRETYGFSGYYGHFEEFYYRYITYNEEGLIAATHEISEGGHESYQTYDYDAYGRVIEMVASGIYETDGSKFRITTKYFYPDDEKDYYTRWETYDENGLLMGASEFIYDENDVYIEQISYDSEGNMLSRYVIEHDENGNYIGSTSYDGEGNITGSSKVE